MADVKAIMDSLIEGDHEKLLGMVRNSSKSEKDVVEILNGGLIAGMNVIGEKMESGEIFIPEVLMRAKIMRTALEILKPYLPKDESIKAGKVVIGTVKGDLHDIGKNLVIMMLEGAGFEVHDLGIDVAPETFIDAAKKHNANIVALSALLTTTMPMMKQTVGTIVESGLRNQVKIIIGGAPITHKFSDEIGADGFAPDAGSATRLAKQLIE